MELRPDFRIAETIDFARVLDGGGAVEICLEGGVELRLGMCDADAGEARNLPRKTLGRDQQGLELDNAGHQADTPGLRGVDIFGR